MYFGAIGAEATLAAVTGAGLAIDRSEVVEDDEDGEPVPFLWVTATRTTPPAPPG